MVSQLLPQLPHRQSPAREVAERARRVGARSAVCRGDGCVDELGNRYMVCYVTSVAFSST